MGNKHSEDLHRSRVEDGYIQNVRLKVGITTVNPPE